MKQALYRKYRSKKLNEIVGQSHVTEILARSLKKGIVSHAYLFTGPRGVGKTSIARILAHEINGLEYNEESSHLDIIEIDAASNNGVEDVRDLREKARIAPTSASKKIYIIDEVHMLSKPAFNALLKTLEEPPEHIVFILATTDIEKLPATIVSRTQRFNFRRIMPDDATEHLAHIAKQEKIAIEKDALRLIAHHGDGSFRDSISLLDQLQNLVSANEKITHAMVEKHLGLASQDIIEKLLEAYEKRDLATLVALCDDIDSSGTSVVVLVDQLMSAIRKQVIERPGLLPLLDKLLDVAKSSHPGLKLLVALSPEQDIAQPKPTKTSAALASPSPSISAPIAELERQATKAHPKMKPVAENIAKSSKAKTPSNTIDWQAIVELARKESVALYSVLTKCGHAQDGGTLNIYARNNFYKKKLDDTRHQRTFTTVLESLGYSDLQTTIHATTPPLKDSQAAAVAAIMGGGEEVAL